MVQVILSDRDIQRELSYAHGLGISGLDCRDIGPASVDVYLDDTLTLQNGHTFKFERHTMSAGQFILASTREVVTVPDNIACQVHGCSSIGRTGLAVQNAGWVDPGFSGALTLELHNTSSGCIILEAGQRIAQLSFAYLHTPAAKPYSGRYQGQRGATAARPPRPNG